MSDNRETARIVWGDINQCPDVKDKRLWAIDHIAKSIATARSAERERIFAIIRRVADGAPPHSPFACAGPGFIAVIEREAE